MSPPPGEKGDGVGDVSVMPPMRILRKYLVAAWRSCSRSSAVCLLKLKHVEQVLVNICSTTYRSAHKVCFKVYFLGILMQFIKCPTLVVTKNH